MENIMLETALRYAKLGISVIPVSRDKAPLIEFADREPLTEEEIISIWTQNPTANIAMKCDKFVVVDVDVHNEVNGYESIEQLLNEKWWLPTLSQTTASGGKQYIFLKREDMVITQRIGFLKGVDIKAHDNNYVVIPPSMTRKGQYKWDNQLPIVTAPKELVREIMKGKDNFNHSDFSAFTTTGSSKTAKLFEMIVHGLGDSGGRNDALAKFIGGLFLRNVDFNAVYQLAKQVNHATADPLDEKEFERTFESMFKKEMRRRNGTRSDGS
ncbi:bifunctional DNA primase/polymerase [Lactococcus garvieae]|uniref:bifunctional DNA primase/polymerase n=1 Tax=Lactococcus garvieae TaxID=1363 RepID=UPI0038538B31